MQWIINASKATVIPVLSLVVLTACGGLSNDSTELSQSTDNGDTSGSTSSSSSSSSGSSSSSSSSSGSSGSNAGGDAVAGRASYLSVGCNSCHGENGDGGDIIDPNKALYDNKSLALYINDTMPTFNPELCEGACAENIAAFIRNWTQTNPEPDNGIASCNQVSYGPRLLRVLTKSEFSNAVRDLTGIDIQADLGPTVNNTLPADNIVNDFSNNTNTSIETSTLQAYNLVVDKLVDKLAENSFNNIVDCAQLTADACAAALINNFVPKVYRRPLKDTETEALREFFDARLTGGDVLEGVASTLRSIFTSPQFLYRDETGVSVADIESGDSSDGDGDFVQDGEIQSLIPAAESPREVLIYQRTDASNVRFTGNDLIVINVSGTQSQETGLWPTLSITVDNQEVASVLVDHSFQKTYQFRTTDIDGEAYTAFINQQVGANEEYKGGHNLNIFSIEVSAAIENTLLQPDRTLDPDAYVLSPYQMASFLSFTFAGTTPDDTLLVAAAARELDTEEQISAQIDRQLNTQAARAHFGDHAAQWLKTDRVLALIKDNDVYPGFTQAVRDAMAQEVRDVYNHVVLDEGEPFTALFNGNFTFANGALADFYGLGGAAGNSLQKITGISSRAGLVTSGAFLAVNAHEADTGPILRAVRLRRRFLCHDVPAPPTGVSLSGENFDEARADAVREFEEYLTQNNGLATSKRKYEFQTSSELCQTCHAEMINPLGFGFEDFDAVGLPQTVDFNGLAVESEGTLYGVNEVGGADKIDFNGAVELAHGIANLDVTRQCFIDNTFRLAMGTGAKTFDPAIDVPLSPRERDDYSCEVQKLDQAMSDSNFSTRTLLKALGNMDSVRYRKDIQR